MNIKLNPLNRRFVLSSDQSIDDLTDGLAHPLQLGNPLGNFSWNQKRAIADLSIGAGLTIGLFLCCIGYIFIRQLLVPVIFYSGLLGLAIAQGYAGHRLHRGVKRYLAKQVLVLFDHGLVDARTNPPRSLHYNQVRHLQLAVINTYSSTKLRDEHYVDTQLTFTLACFNQPILQLNNELNDIETIGKILRDAWLEHQLPTAMTTYLQGEALYFGELVLSQADIAYRGETVAIAHLDPIHFQDGHLILASQIDNWRKQFRIAEFPNLDLLLTLLHWINSTATKNTATLT
jgi:hypothetical protein